MVGWLVGWACISELVTCLFTPVLLGVMPESWPECIVEHQYREINASMVVPSASYLGSDDDDYPKKTK